MTPDSAVSPARVSSCWGNGVLPSMVAVECDYTSTVVGVMGR
ncbi:hypothetical protein A2U01_0005698 [Trifolium medium]|uniref:Uncharacterized protein n=1 Tax=Trifolium medium TaxID=97028 RepID=A0A392MC54_9FABA|nr:hypothetical protein [Trifolium medium]